jgi:hypothetical protein
VTTPMTPAGNTQHQHPTTGSPRHPQLADHVGTDGNKNGPSTGDERPGRQS